MARIQEIHIFQLDLPIVGPAYRMATSELTHLDTTLIEIVTENGHSGFGEVCPLGSAYQPAHASGARAAITEVAPQLIGMEILEIENIRRKMNVALSGHAYAKAAIDIAVWDLMGKTLDLRVCDLLGGAVSDSVPSYYAIGIETPEGVAEQIIDKQKQGYKRLQLKIGGRDIEEDIAVARKAFEVRDPSTRIALDANRSLTTRDAITLSNSLRDLNFVLEQPCDSYEEIKSLKGRICHPIYLDECTSGPNVVMQSIVEGVADGFGMKLTRVGGLSVMRNIRDICQSSQRPLTCDDSWGGDITAAACVHIGATIDPHLFEGTWIANNYIKGNYDEEHPICVENGHIKVPTRAGLGVEPDKSNWKTITVCN